MDVYGVIRKGEHMFVGKYEGTEDRIIKCYEGTMVWFRKLEHRSVQEGMDTSLLHSLTFLDYDHTACSISEKSI